MIEYQRRRYQLPFRLRGRWFFFVLLIHPSYGIGIGNTDQQGSQQQQQQTTFQGIGKKRKKEEKMIDMERMNLLAPMRYFCAVLAAAMVWSQWWLCIITVMGGGLIDGRFVGKVKMVSCFRSI